MLKMTPTSTSLVTTVDSEHQLQLRAQAGWTTAEWKDALRLAGVDLGLPLHEVFADYTYEIDPDGVEVWTFTK